MEESNLRDQIVECCRRMHARGLTSGGEGNVSVRLGSGRFLVTPSGVNKGFIAPADLVVADSEGRPVRTAGLGPSSEFKVHLAAYRARPDCDAVVHAHPPTAVALTLAGVSLAQCLMPESVVALGEIPTAPYATPSTQAVADGVEGLLAGHCAVMLERHGSLTIGRDVFEAYDRLESLEHAARITWMARLAGPVKPLPADEVGRLRAMAAEMGLRRGPCVACGTCRAPGEAYPSCQDDALIAEVISRVMGQL